MSGYSYNTDLIIIDYLEEFYDKMLQICGVHHSLLCNGNWLRVKHLKM